MIRGFSIAAARTRAHALTVLVLTVVLAAGIGIGVAIAADQNLNDADNALQKAQALLEAVVSVPESKQAQRRFERHLDRALDHIQTARDHIAAAIEVADNDTGN